MQKENSGSGLDYFLIGFATIGLVLALYFLFSDGLLITQENFENLKPVGQFTKASGDVRQPGFDPGVSEWENPAAC